MSDGPQSLEAEIAAMVKELETLALDKASRDRRLALNAQLEEKRATLERVRRRAQVERELADVNGRLASEGDKLQRRGLAKRRSELEAELAEPTSG